jgi:hypothetical protein
MQDISPEALQLVEQGASHFIHVVQRAAAESRQRKEPISVFLTLDAFYDDPMLLYASLWYAYSQGVVVTFCPKQVDREQARVPLEANTTASGRNKQNKRRQQN